MGKPVQPWPGCELVLRADAPREEWLQARDAGLGGSDMVVLMGFGYKNRTEYGLWLEKTGQRPHEESGVNIRMRRGNHMEAFIAHEFEQVAAEAFGVVSLSRVGLVRSLDDEMMLASTDYRVTYGDGESAVVECKHVDNYASAKVYRELQGAGADQIKRLAPRFFWQGVHYLAVTGAVGCWLAIDSPFFDELVVSFIDALDVSIEIQQVKEKARQWWTRHVTLGLAVEQFGEELKSELGDLLADAVEAPLPWELAEDVERLKELNYPNSAAGKAEVKAIKHRIEAQIGAHPVLLLDGVPVVRWQARNNPGGLDKEAMERDHPGLLRKYSKPGHRSRYVTLIRPEPGGTTTEEE